MGDISKAAYVSRKNELLIERNQLDAQPAAASVALQRQRIESVIEDWSVMTDDERKQVIQMIFAEIRADHTTDALKVKFRTRAAWEPYIEAVLATQGETRDTSTAQPRSNLVTVADCYRGCGRGEDRRNAGVKRAEVITARLGRSKTIDLSRLPIAHAFVAKPFDVRVLVDTLGQPQFAR
jgi:hypothetical protein